MSRAPARAYTRLRSTFQNLNLERALVLKFVQPLISLGAVVAREPNLTDPTFTLPSTPDRSHCTSPAGGDDGRLLPHPERCCHPQAVRAALTIAILSIVSTIELSVSAVYTANPLTGDGVSIDVEYISSR